VIEWLNTIVQGVLLGGLYALFAMGLSLIFGVMRLTNIAHGDFIVLAAFGAFALTSHAGIGPFGALAFLLPLAVAFGYALQRVVLNATLTRDPLPSLVVTFGLSIIIQNMLQEIFSADPRSIPAGKLTTASVQLVPGVTVGVLPVLIFGAAVLVAAALQWLFVRTTIGSAFRATSDDRETAELMGLDARIVYAWASAIAFAVIAVAGLLQGMRTTVAPADGPGLLLYAFEAVVIGGLGSFWGTFAGGVILGVTQTVGFRLDPGWGIWLGHVVFLVILLVRPAGLFPRMR
jgi:branched-chain amino acid transport system permease protein